MNKAITDGLVLMPPPFSAGLNLWSRENGTVGSGSYLGQPNAALVSNDQDFAGCLELQKTEATQKLRSFAQTPIQPGLYLQVTARVKAVSGNLPSVRIAAWAGDIADANVAGVVQVGPSVTLTTYGEVVTVQAIISPATRTGVDMAWGTTASVKRLVGAVQDKHPELNICLHLHDTRGMGIANAYAGLEMGVNTFDAAVAGLGGCPFAGHAGAAGNVCTEDLVFMCDEMGIETGINLEALMESARLAEEIVGHPLPGSVMRGGSLRALREQVAAARAA